MHRLITLCCGSLVLAGSLAALPATIAAQDHVDPWMARAPKISFERLQRPDTGFQLDIPKKDWMLLPSSGAVLLVLASRKGDAVVLVERSALRAALAPADITDVFAEIEIDAIKAQQPNAVDFRSKILEAGSRKLAAVQYTQPGPRDRERVRRYSMPIGRQLYRLTCISQAGRFDSYDPLFSHIAGSFAVTE